MKIVVIGTGYVGLVTGACFAELGVEVCCVDIDKAKIDALQQGEIPIYEPELQDIVKRNTIAQRLTFSTSTERVIADADAIFIAVGTPADEDGSADVKYVLAAGRDIGRTITG